MRCLSTRNMHWSSSRITWQSRSNQSRHPRMVVANLNTQPINLRKWMSATSTCTCRRVWNMKSRMLTYLRVQMVVVGAPIQIWKVRERKVHQKSKVRETRNWIKRNSPDSRRITFTITKTTVTFSTQRRNLNLNPYHVGQLGPSRGQVASISK